MRILERNARDATAKSFKKNRPQEILWAMNGIYQILR